MTLPRKVNSLAGLRGLLDAAHEYGCSVEIIPVDSAGTWQVVVWDCCEHVPPQEHRIVSAEGVDIPNALGDGPRSLVARLHAWHRGERE